METHSSILAWRILWAEEPGRLQSMGPQSWTQLSDKHFHFGDAIQSTTSNTGNGASLQGNVPDLEAMIPGFS